MFTLCYRVCNPRYYLCGNNEVGCLTSDDCQTGYFCNTDLAQPRCEDINECAVDNGHYEGSLYCGDNSVCANTVGSFTCSCNTGYTDFQPHAGCIDINECDVGGNNCQANTDCWNTPGSFLCACKIGFTGSPTSKCYDINECLDSDWNACKTNDKVITYQFCDDAWQSLPLDSVNVKDGELIKYSFSAVTNRNKVTVSVGIWASRYSFYLNSGTLFFYHCVETRCNLIKETPFNDMAKIRSGKNNFKNYFFSFLYENGQTSVEFGVNNDTVVLSTVDPNAKLDIINKLFLRNKYDWKQCTYVRNFKAAGPSSTCMNTVGSYTCIDDSSEKIGIGFGGYTTSGSDYAPEITVITADKAVCSDHNILDFGGRYSPGLHECF